jgi:hypothetical protein
MANKHNDKRRHHIPTMKYNVTNRAEYDAGLLRRGRLTLWVTDEAMANWHAALRLTADGQPCYPDLAIKTGLMLRLAFHLPLRQIEGLISHREGILSSGMVSLQQRQLLLAVLRSSPIFSVRPMICSACLQNPFITVQKQ